MRLRDVAQVEDSFETRQDRGHASTARRSISLAVLRQPDANTVQVVDAVRADAARLPVAAAAVGAHRRSVNDRSVSIREALHDVTLTMLGTIVLVVLVIFLFLRRFVATVIPTLSLPVSLVGAVSLLWAFGYTLDNISLLGLTLAVGLVVDDAIVMLENIMRHVENGEPPFQAALRGSREVGFTIISISISLVAVFIPIFFMPGVIGLLFHEFAVIVSLAIVVSAFVSLTLVPMLASRFLKRRGAQEARRARSSAPSSAASTRCSAATRARSTSALRHRRFVLGVALRDLRRDRVAVRHHAQGLLPRRRTSARSGSAPRRRRTPPSRPWCSCRTRRGRHHARRSERARPSTRSTAAAARRTPGGMFINLKPRGEREPMKEVVESLRRKLREVPGITGLHAADPEPAARRPPEQGAVPVHPAERARPTS